MTDVERLGSAHRRSMVLVSMKKQTEQARWSKPASSIPPRSLNPFLPSSSCPGFPQQQAVRQIHSPFPSCFWSWPNSRHLTNLRVAVWSGLCSSQANVPPLNDIPAQAQTNPKSFSCLGAFDGSALLVYLTDWGTFLVGVYLWRFSHLLDDIVGCELLPAIH